MGEASRHLAGQAVADVARALRSSGVVKRLPTGQALFRQGDRGSTVYLIERGEIKLTIGTGTAEFTISIVGQGTVLGAVELLDGQPRAATATATSPCTLIAIPGRAFDALLERNPCVRLHVMSVLADDVRCMQRRLAAQCSQTTLERVAGRLLDLSTANPDADDPCVQTTQNALAEWIGSTRESTARALAQLRQRGWITTGRGWIRIDDREALTHLERL